MHIELTSRCTLACPGCSRTWFSEKFNRPFPKQDLDIDDFSRFMDCEQGHSVKHMLLCGNHGDPIYYPNLFNFIDRFRRCRFKISTSGSHQSVKFWKNLNQHLTEDDKIYFSIDGLEHNNHLYRRNSDWKSIMTALDLAISGPAKIVWKSIIFRYNQSDISTMKQIAEDKGIAFVVEPTDYYGDESLRPDDTKLIKFDRNYTTSLQTDKIVPGCYNSNTEYVSADGYYWPCCQISNMHILHRTPLWKNRKDWTIHNHTLDDLRRQTEQWAGYVEADPVTAPDACKMNCKPGQNDFGGVIWPRS